MITSDHNTNWVRIRKSRFDKGWLIKLYDADALYYFDYEESERADTFDGAIKMADYLLGRSK